MERTKKIWYLSLRNFWPAINKFFQQLVRPLTHKVYIRNQVPLYLWRIKLMLKCWIVFCFIFFFSFFFHKHSQITVQQGKRDVIYLTPLYWFHPIHKCLDISQTVTEETSPLHIAIGRIPTPLVSERKSVITKVRALCCIVLLFHVCDCSKNAGPDLLL